MDEKITVKCNQKWHIMKEALRPWAKYKTKNINGN